MSDLNPQPLPPLRINVTAGMLDSRESMQKITDQVLNLIGCPNCHSGRILDFRHLEEVTVNPETLEVLPVSVVQR